MGVTDWFRSAGGAIKSSDDWVREQLRDPLHRAVFGDNTATSQGVQASNEEAARIVAENQRNYGSGQLLGGFQKNPHLAMLRPTGHEGGPAIDPNQLTIGDLIQMMLGGGGDGGAGAAAAQKAAIEQAVAKINEDYQRQIAAISANRDRGATSIGDAMNTFNASTAANNASYSQGAASLNRAIADRAAQMAASARQNDQQAAGRANTLGWNGSAIAQNAANNNMATGNVNRYSQDLANRFQQVQSGAQQQTANAGALMNQGALGSLANNFAAANNAAEQGRSDATFQAQNQSAGGGGGGGRGGGGTSMMDAVKGASAYLDLVNKFNGGGTADSNTGLMYAMFQQDPTGFAANPEYQKYLPQMGSIYAKQKLS